MFEYLLTTSLGLFSKRNKKPFEGMLIERGAFCFVFLEKESSLKSEINFKQRFSKRYKSVRAYYSLTWSPRA